MSNIPFTIQAYNSTQLAAHYKISYKIFLKWLKPFRNELGEQIGRVWNINQVNLIIQKLGHP